MKACRTRFAISIALAGWVTAAGAGHARADAQLLAYGKHLSQECTSCHRRDGADKGIPTIVGLEVDYFVTTMKFYQSGARTNQTMNSVALALNDDQLKALGVYFATLKPAVAATGKAKK